jgi:hypothetical protein
MHPMSSEEEIPPPNQDLQAPSGPEMPPPDPPAPDDDDFPENSEDRPDYDIPDGAESDPDDSQFRDEINAGSGF